LNACAFSGVSMNASGNPDQLVPGTQYLDRVAIGYLDAPALDGLALINRRTCVPVCA